jgi:3-deoxy-D-manno-octulosonate 8-phosphate phosphatase (KDO 8-P phosphatase)
MPEQIATPTTESWVRSFYLQPPADYPPELVARARQIRLLGMDVDGVLTPSDILYLSNGEEMKCFNVKDGHGLWMLTQANLKTAIITGRQSPITQRRAEELSITYLFQGIKQKRPILQQVVDELGLSLDQVAYIGDDLPDLPVLEGVGLSCCPADAVPQVKLACQFITQQPGGQGAVRELCDLLLYAWAKSAGQP